PAPRPHPGRRHCARHRQPGPRSRTRPRSHALFAAALPMRFLAAVFASIAFATTGAFAETKVLRVAHQSIGGDAIDPAQLNSVLVAHLLDNLIEPMLRYDYLPRPP